MCLLGARGNTAEEMRKGLKYDGLEDSDIHAGLSDYIAALSKDNLPFTMNAANRLYARKEYKFLDDFITSTKKYYFADATEADFAGDAEGARAEINKWVEGETENKITELLPSGSVSELTSLVLVNAVYFKGDWDAKFDPRGTHSRAFITSPTDTVDTDYMFMSKYFNYTASEELGARVLEIAYKNKDLSFFVLLPNKSDGLADMEAKLSADTLSTVKSQLKYTRIEAYIPKFKQEFTSGLMEKLGELGMMELFTAGVADLSGMDGGRQLSVSSVQHKAFIEVNEEGSEAAGASGLSVELVALEEMNEFIAQHPFLYMIVDNGSGVVLFMGRYCHP